MSKKQVFIVVGLLVLIAAGGLAWYFLNPARSGGIQDSGNGKPGYTLTGHDRGMGNPKAKVVLIEYGAPSCPVCARFDSESLPQLKQNYIDTGKIYYVFRVFPLRADDGAAEKLARCLPEDKYFTFIDLLFRNQPKWDVEYSQENPALATPQGVHDGLILLSRIAGMSADQADKCMTDTGLDNTINQVGQDGEQRYGINSTPTFILDGGPVFQGNLPNYAEMSAALDKELAANH